MSARPTLAAGLWAALVCMCSACMAPTAPASPGAPVAASTPPVSGEISAGALLENALAQQGRVLVVTGTFAGWTGPCRGAPPRTRSDWMLTDGPACIYVSGPVPAGVTPPPDTVSIGVRIKVRAEVKAAPDGRPYLQSVAP